MTASGAARPPISVQLYTVRDQLDEDTPGTLRRLAALGLRNVEPFDLVGKVDSLAGPMAELGLAAPTTHVSFVDAGVAPALAAAGRLGVGTIIEPWLPEERWTSREDIAAIAAGLNDAARRAADEGITVGYHNHWWELELHIDGVTALEVLADHLDPAVVLELDTYWCAVGGADPVALLDRLGERVVALHIKDGPISRDAALQVPAGTGAMDFTGILTAAPAARAVLEFDLYAGDLFEGLAQGIGFLQGRGASL